jgi:predicted nuclease of restriction endonuclease-like (RecB) superfamily
MKNTGRMKTGTKAVAPAPVHTADSSDRKGRGRQREDASFPLPPSRLELPGGYDDLLGEIKRRIQTERLRTVMAANSAMVLLYWDIGRLILERQEREGWGAKVIYRLAADLHAAYPDMSGLSPRNLKYMRSFAAAWPDAAIVQEVLAQIPWYHHIALLDKLDDSAVRQWYAYKTVELKAVSFDPGFVGTMNMYLSAVDDLLRHPEDKPSVGLILCRSKSKLIVEYALRGFKKPIGVADWETKLVRRLPKELRGSLPTVEEIETELTRTDDAQ